MLGFAGLKSRLTPGATWNRSDIAPCKQPGQQLPGCEACTWPEHSARKHTSKQRAPSPVPHSKPGILRPTKPLTLPLPLPLPHLHPARPNKETSTAGREPSWSVCIPPWRVSLTVGLGFRLYGSVASQPHHGRSHTVLRYARLGVQRYFQV